MNLDPLLERFPQSHHVLVRDLDRVLGACRAFATPVTKFALSPSQPTDFEQHLDFAMSVYADKFLQLYETLAESLLSERYLVYAQSARSILENAATLRYYSRSPEITLLRTSEQSTPAMTASGYAS